MACSLDALHSEQFVEPLRRAEMWQGFHPPPRATPAVKTQPPPEKIEAPAESPKALGSPALQTEAPVKTEPPPVKTPSPVRNAPPNLGESKEFTDYGIHREQDVDFSDDDANDSSDDDMHRELDGKTVQDDEQKCFSELCKMLRDERKLGQETKMATLDADRQLLFYRARKIEDDSMAQIAKIKKQTLREFATQENWRSSQPKLTNPYEKGFHQDRHRARALDQESIWRTATFEKMTNKLMDEQFNLCEALTALFSTPTLQGRPPPWLPLAPMSRQVLDM